MKSGIILAVGEDIRWEGRPAPRCYTFRHWRHSLFGLIFLAITSYWQVLGIDMSKEYDLVWLAWLPTPFVFIGLCLAFGPLLQARLEWDHVYYAITDRRLLVKRGLLRRRLDFLELSEITYFSLLSHGDQLGTLRVYRQNEMLLTLHCLEYPRQATDLLEEVMGRGLSAEGNCPLPNSDCGTLDANVQQQER